MAGRRPLELSIDQRDIQRVVAALKSEANGKDLKRDLVREIKAAAAPVIVELKASINAVATGNGSPSIAHEIAQNIKPSVRISGGNPGVAIKAGATPGVRGFNKAASAFNAPSWRRRVYGRAWVTQVGKPRWFDSVTAENREQFHESVMKSVEEMARRIASRSRR